MGLRPNPNPLRLPLTPSKQGVGVRGRNGMGPRLPMPALVGGLVLRVVELVFPWLAQSVGVRERVQVSKQVEPRREILGYARRRRLWKRRPPPSGLY